LPLRFNLNVIERITRSFPNLDLPRHSACSAPALPDALHALVVDVSAMMVE
jgi:hypothetical protein